MAYVPRLKEKYDKEIVPELKKQFGFKSLMRVPKITKICLNQGIGAATADRKLIDIGISEMTAIAGQKAVATTSRKDISNFKLRKGNPIGVRVTLRGERMYEFLDRLISVSIPRIRDFRGISDKGFDGRGTHGKKWSRFRYVLDSSSDKEFRLPDIVEINPGLDKQALSYHSIPSRIWSRIMYLLH